MTSQGQGRTVAAVAGVKIPHRATRTSTVIVRFLANDDVVMGRGKFSICNTGNIRFGVMTRVHQAEYQATRNRCRKDMIARKVVQEVYANKGRFLCRVESPEEKISLGIHPDETAFVLADETAVLSKAKQTLRYKMNSVNEEDKTPLSDTKQHPFANVHCKRSRPSSPETIHGHSKKSRLTTTTVPAGSEDSLPTGYFHGQARSMRVTPPEQRDSMRVAALPRHPLLHRQASLLVAPMEATTTAAAVSKISRLLAVHDRSPPPLPPPAHYHHPWTTVPPVTMQSRATMNVFRPSQWPESHQQSERALPPAPLPRREETPQRSVHETLLMLQEWGVQQKLQSQREEQAAARALLQSMSLQLGTRQNEDDSRGNKNAARQASSEGTTGDHLNGNTNNFASHDMTSLGRIGTLHQLQLLRLQQQLNEQRSHQQQQPQTESNAEQLLLLQLQLMSPSSNGALSAAPAFQN